jgi:Branched-chain amino acid aminotransferase/4-amino-4-deoxychorismate lyase
VFACGTAAVITPVGRVKSETAEWTVADGEPGAVTMRLREDWSPSSTATSPTLQLDPQGLLTNRVSLTRVSDGET